MGATRRVSRRMQRRDLNKVRKEITRQTDRRVQEMIDRQMVEVEAAGAAWDPFGDDVSQTAPLPGEVH